MKTKKTLAVITAGLLAGATLLGGCSHGVVQKATLEDITSYTTQVGKPISVSGSVGYGEAYLAAVLDVQGTPSLGYVMGTSHEGDVIKAEALIESEINDNDEESIVWSGIQRQDGLQIKQIEVHDYVIKF